MISTFIWEGGHWGEHTDDSITKKYGLLQGVQVLADPAQYKQFGEHARHVADVDYWAR